MSTHLNRTLLPVLEQILGVKILDVQRRRVDLLPARRMRVVPLESLDALRVRWLERLSSSTAHLIQLEGGNRLSRGKAVLTLEGVP